MMKHLKGGVAKGAFSETEAQKRFEAWKQEKNSKLSNIVREEADKKRDIVKKRIAEEVKVKEAMSAKIAARNAEIAAAAAKAAEEEAAAKAAEEASEAAEAVAEEAAAAEEAPATEEAAPEA